MGVLILITSFWAQKKTDVNLYLSIDIGLLVLILFFFTAALVQLFHVIVSLRSDSSKCHCYRSDAEAGCNAHKKTARILITLLFSNVI